MTASPVDREQGFTLLELLVALVVFGFILTGLGQGLRFGLQAWDRQARAIAAGSDFDAIDHTLRTLLAGLDPAVAVVGQAHAVAFTSDLPESAAPPTRHADMLLLSDARGRLVLRWIPHLHAQRFGPAPPSQEEVLLDAIARIDLAYWDRSGSGRWLETWKDNNPPALIRVRLVFPVGDPRHWPDIIGAVMRDRSGV